MHAVNARDGKGIWRSDRLLVHSFVESWPVVFDGKVILRYHATHKLAQTRTDSNYTESWDKRLVILNEATGREGLVAPQVTTGMGGPTKPPPVPHVLRGLCHHTPFRPGWRRGRSRVAAGGRCGSTMVLRECSAGT